MPVTQTNFPSIVPILVSPVPQKGSAHRDVTREISHEEPQRAHAGQVHICLCVSTRTSAFLSLFGVELTV